MLLKFASIQKDESLVTSRMFSFQISLTYFVSIAFKFPKKKIKTILYGRNI